MKKMTPIIIFLIIPIISFAQYQSNEEIDQLIIFHTFNGNWPAADSLLDAQIKKYSDSPKYYSMKAQYYFYTRYFHDGSLRGDSLMEKCAEFAQKAIDVGEKSDMSIDDQFFVGSAYGYLSRYYGRRGDFWDAYWKTRSAFGYLDDVLEEDPNYADAYMEKAVIEYFIAFRVRGFYGFVAWMLGMDSDRDVALEHFHTVAEKGNLCKGEALYALSMIYRFFENDLQQATELNAKLVEMYPQNPFMANQNTQLRFMALVEEKGVQFLETEFDSLEAKYNVTNPGLLNTLGYNFINQNRLEDAIEVFKVNIKLFPDVANGYDSISEAYVALGNNEMAIHNSQICLQKLAADSTINDEFRQNLKEISEERIKELGAEPQQINI
jgi:tetratricopeptide (TPR) repeat protein